jgi:hypothetical protein
MDTKTQTDDLASRLNDAVMRAAMPEINDEQNAITTLEKPVKSEEDRRGGAFVKGGTPGPGRPKGSVPKAVKTIRDAVLEAFDQVGGVAYLAKLASGTQSDRAAFVGLVAKVLPTQINATVDGGIQVQLSWLSGRSIGTTASQTQEQMTQVIDLERDNGGKYRIVDPTTQAEAGAGGGSEADKAAGDAQGA